MVFIATHFLKRGAEVIIGCRRDYPDEIEELKKLSNSDKVRLRIIDLSDLRSIDAFVQGMKDDNVTLDISVHNAGVTPPKARKTKQGFDQSYKNSPKGKSEWVLNFSARAA